MSCCCGTDPPLRQPPRPARASVSILSSLAGPHFYFSAVGLIRPGHAHSRSNGSGPTPFMRGSAGGRRHAQTKGVPGMPAILASSTTDTTPPHTRPLAPTSRTRPYVRPSSLVPSSRHGHHNKRTRERTFTYPGSAERFAGGFASAPHPQGPDTAMLRVAATGSRFRQRERRGHPRENQRCCTCTTHRECGWTV